MINPFFIVNDFAKQRPLSICYYMRKTLPCSTWSIAHKPNWTNHGTDQSSICSFLPLLHPAGVGHFDTQVVSDPLAALGYTKLRNVRGEKYSYHVGGKRGV
jgi:hypothetical protein